MPDSRTPRKLTSVRSATAASEIATLCASRLGAERHDREHPGGDRDRDGQDVVDEQRRARRRGSGACRDCPWQRRTHPRSSGRPARSAVRDDDDREQRGDRDRDGQDAIGGAAEARRGRREPPRSRRRPTREGPRRRPAGRASSRGACPPSRGRARTPDEEAFDQVETLDPLVERGLLVFFRLVIALPDASPVQAADRPSSRIFRAS